MKLAKMTQEKLARRLNLSRSLVGHWLTGTREPNDDHFRRVAEVLRVDERWLRGETIKTGDPAEAGWHFPKPLPGQRDFGNANVWTVPADIKTHVREGGQNVADAADPASSAIVVRIRVIELHGDDALAFLEAARFEELRPHIEAAAEQRGKLSRKLEAGLRRVDKRPDRLLLLRFDDFGTRGLTGPEQGEGSFAALVRNNLDSVKQSTSAGGSFGLGKAAHWRCSDVSTVFFNSVTDEFAARVIARSELTYHEIGEDRYAGPGWYGRMGIFEYAESIDDQALAERLLLAREPLPEEVQSYVSSANGTSILVVAYQNPASEELDDPATIVEEIEREVAVNFWPALRRRKMIALVEHQVDSQILSRKIVDPRNFVPDFCRLLDKYEAGETVDAFERDGDIVAVPVPIRLPKCKSDRPDVIRHEAVESETALLVGLADTEESADVLEAVLDAAKTRLKRSLVNSVALVRGPLMVTQYQKKDGILVGARPFYALLLAGEAAELSTESAFVEQFLRASEPPAHDRWTFTDDLREIYERGAKKKLEAFLRDDLPAALKRVLRIPARNASDGPDELKKLLHLGGRGTGGGQGSAPAILRNVSAQFIDSRWAIRADVLVKKRDARLSIRPYIAINAESGNPARVPWHTLELVQASGVELREHEFEAAAAVTKFTFKGTTEPSAVLVDPKRCSARLSLSVRTLAAEKGKTR